MFRPLPEASCLVTPTLSDAQYLIDAVRNSFRVRFDTTFASTPPISPEGPLLYRALCASINGRRRDDAVWCLVLSCESGGFCDAVGDPPIEVGRMLKDIGLKRVISVRTRAAVGPIAGRDRAHSRLEALVAALENVGPEHLILGAIEDAQPCLDASVERAGKFLKAVRRRHKHALRCVNEVTPPPRDTAEADLVRPEAVSDKRVVQELAPQSDKVTPIPTLAPMRRIRRCILHIGTGKTGSTSVQTYLRAHASNLEEASVCAPLEWSAASPFLLLNTRSAHQVRAHLDIDRYNFEGRRQRYLDSLAEEISNSRAEDLVLSSEHFAGETAQGISLLRKWLDEFCDSVEVILYVRRQDRHAVSLHSTRVKSNNIKPIFSNSMDGHFYDELLLKWSSIFNASEITVRVFERERLVGGDVVTDFLRTIGVDVEVAKISTTNESLSLEKCNLVADILDEIDAPFPLPRKIKTALMHICQSLPTLTPLSARRRDAWAYYEQFRSSNQRLGRLLGTGGEVFSDDFTMYPEIYDYEARYDVATYQRAKERLTSMIGGAGGLRAQA